MSEFLNRQCRQAGCGGPASGRCLEHFPFEECPNLIDLDGLSSESLPPGEIETVGTDDASADFTGELVKVSVGPVFATQDADGFLRRSGGVVVSILAGPEVGKTTLIATMYELSRRKALSKLRFGGSDTIRGFEERCYLSRHSSGGDKADTQRTRRGSPQFLHLRLSNELTSFDLLLADRAGEFFEDVLNEPGSILSMPEVVRADHLLLLVDGAELFHRFAQAKATARRIFQALSQNDLLAGKVIHLVITKTDLFSEDQISILEARARGLCDFISGTHSSTILHLTSARRGVNGAAWGAGIDGLMEALAPRREDPAFAPVEFPSSVHHYDALSRFNDAFRGGES